MIAVLLGMALASCIQAPAPESPFAGETVPTAPAPAHPTTTTDAPLANTSIRLVSQSTYYHNLHYDIWAPSLIESGALPIVVVVPGDSPNNSRGLTPLARQLAERGAVVMTIELVTPIVGARHPEPLVAVSCALATARRDASDYGADGAEVTLVGYDLGATLAIIVSQDPGLFLTDCPATRIADEQGVAAGETAATTTTGADALVPAAPGPARVVGIAGLYDLDALAANDSMRAYFGGTQDEQPGLWASGDPYAYLGRRTDVSLLVIGGELDTVAAWPIHQSFSEAASEAGHQVELIEIAQAGHTSLVSPDGELDDLVGSISRFVSGTAG